MLTVVLVTVVLYILLYFLGGLFTFLLVAGMLLFIINMNYTRCVTHAGHKHSILEFVTGKYLAIQFCKVTWDWTEPHTVGKTMTFRIKVSNRISNRLWSIVIALCVVGHRVLSLLCVRFNTKLCIAIVLRSIHAWLHAKGGRNSLLLMQMMLGDYGCGF